MKRLTTAVVAIAFVAIAISLYIRNSHASPIIRTDDGALVFLNDDGLAASGYDVVGYFTANSAIEGKAEHTATYQGATYQFANAENQQAFEANPTKFAPQYGGYCAWGVAAQNDLFPTQPDLFEIVDGKLYLNFNEDVQQQWSVDKTGFISSADKNWPGLQNSHTPR